MQHSTSNFSPIKTTKRRKASTSYQGKNKNSTLSGRNKHQLYSHTSQASHTSEEQTLLADMEARASATNTTTLKTQD